ncbi:hypothetical protein E3N88_34600 [Mikania micrantha]|uniref:Uncharacterized protein n=1 Tax=Mikania micrantha TaxID=192012 RepID=A0A5N6LYL2_9ASTR|nr:hypothetical protein E3N88_34600 [Mikania micrantha]
MWWDGVWALTLSHFDLGIHVRGQQLQKRFSILSLREVTLCRMFIELIDLAGCFKVKGQIKILPGMTIRPGDMLFGMGGLLRTLMERFWGWSTALMWIQLIRTFSLVFYMSRVGLPVNWRPGSTLGCIYDSGLDRMYWSGKGVDKGAIGIVNIKGRQLWVNILSHIDNTQHGNRSEIILGINTWLAIL